MLDQVKSQELAKDQYTQTLGEKLFDQLKQDEALNLTVTGEEGQFLRFNQAKVRQVGEVKECSVHLLLEVGQKNKKSVRINTIGVGSSFLKNDGSRAYVFLQELARDHGGFFYGF